MTTNPSDIGSYAFGVALNSASYSGGAGGTFTDLVSGNEDWIVASATPTFETRDGLEGMLFSNSATEKVTHELYAVGETTVVAICECDTGLLRYVWGGDNAASNTFGLYINAHTAGCFFSTGSPSASGAHTSGIQVVVAASWSPQNNKTYVTSYDGTLRKGDATPTIVPHTNYWLAGAGIHRNVYFQGLISEIHGFHEALHYRNETLLDDLILTLGAKVGI